VCWSDEVIFYIRAGRSIFYITRGSREKYLKKNLKPTFKSGRTAISAWFCFYRNKIGLLIIIPKGDIMTAACYLEVVKKHFISFYRRIKRKYGPDVIV